MASKSFLDIHSTYYESFLALSVGIRVNKHQLKMESHTNQLQAPVLNYRDITITSESLRESLAAVCPVLGVHNVARVRRGTLALFEVDFIEQKSLGKFCNSMDGLLQSRLHEHLKPKLSPGQELEVTVKLHLIMPNADKKDPQLREVTSDNYQECFSLLRESALFEFGAFDLTHPIPPDKDSDRRELTIDDLREVLQELTEVAAYWFTVGVFLGVPYHELQTIRNDYQGQYKACLRETLAAWLTGMEAPPAAMVQALRAAGMVVLARKIAVKYGVTVIVESNTSEPGIEPSSEVSVSASELITFFSKLTVLANQSSRAQPVQVAVLKTLVAQREELATKEVKYSEISEQLDHLQKKKKGVGKSLEEAKSSLGSVKDQIERLKGQQESLIKKRQEKESQKRWLMKQKDSKFGEELVAVKQLIEDTEKAVTELSENIDELGEKTRTLEGEAEQMKVQLLKQETDKDQLQQKLEETQKEKEALENNLETDRRQFQNEIERMTNELKLQEGKMEVMQSKMEMMQDEQSHRRKLEMALAARSSTSSEHMGCSQFLTNDYFTTQPGQLSILRGEKVRITQTSENGDWCHGEDSSGAVGWLPASYNVKSSDLEKYSWFFGQITRAEAMLVLSSEINGSFLIRESKSKREQFVLSLRYDGRTIHYRVQTDSISGPYYITPDSEFATLVELVEHHSKITDGLTTTLQYPAPNPKKPPVFNMSCGLDEWEYERADLEMRQKIGGGQYGEVYKAVMKSSNIIVAIKTFREKTINPTEFLEEAQVMKKLKHPNLDHLLGVCTKEIPCYIIMEYMQKGNLLDLVQGPEGRELQMVTLVNMSQQVASAMAYLENLNVIHRDLAARSCLIGEHYQVKVANYGLSELMVSYIYNAKEGTNFPIRWTAPESLENSLFSLKSPVWAFGVLLWELTTYGMTPYRGVELSQLYELLETGYRMEYPEGCPPAIYEMMRKCWEWLPEDRPTFAELSSQLDKISNLSSSSKPPLPPCPRPPCPLPPPPPSPPPPPPRHSRHLPPPPPLPPPPRQALSVRN